MKFKADEMATKDCTEVNNFLLEELRIEDFDLSEIDMNLTSHDLLMKDGSNIVMLNEAKDFSSELLEMLVAPQIEDFAIEAPKAKVISIDEKLIKVQQEVMSDITMPLNTMFDEFANYITEAIA